MYTKPRQEARAIENLRNQGFLCVLPTLMVERLSAGRRVQVADALFPRYLFVYLEVGRSNWAAIRSTRGVTCLVEFGGVAARVPSMLIDALAEQPELCVDLFEAGEQVRIVDGAFVGMSAEIERLYEAPDGEARVMVLMDILTRPQRISFPASAVRKAA